MRIVTVDVALSLRLEFTHKPRERAAAAAAAEGRIKTDRLMDQPRAASEEAGVCVCVLNLCVEESDSCMPKLQEPPGVLEEHPGGFDTNFGDSCAQQFSFVCLCFLLFFLVLPFSFITHPGSAGFALKI